MILQQQDSICYHTEIKTDLLEIKELCYKNSYMVLTIFELFRNYVQDQKLSFEYCWLEEAKKNYGFNGLPAFRNDDAYNRASNALFLELFPELVPNNILDKKFWKFKTSKSN